MFSVVFPGQGSQVVGMAANFYKKFDIFKKKFDEADEILDFKLSKLILEGPSEQLNLTENTQPAIFLVSYSIFNLIKKEFNIKIDEANYFAGHSLGEYSAATCAGYLNFEDTLKILKVRGKAMQDAVPLGQGGMLAILGADINTIDKIFIANKSNFECFVANDNSNSQIVVSGTNENIDKLIVVLDSHKIKNIKLSVSAPFHCKLMQTAKDKVHEELKKIIFKDSKAKLISNVTANEVSNKNDLQNLLVKQIENRVRWRESINFIINNGVNNFIEIGPGKVLSGLIRRINKNVKVSAINNEQDISLIKIHD
tara:strand:- start:3489 stop:4421 length:933 start_codon:yes stop_codon:yes gene_type:complete